MTFKAAIAVVAAALVIAAPGSGRAAGVTTNTITEPGGERVLQLSVDIAAPPARVWKGLVDEETLRHWNAPMVRVDLRTGGEIEEGFDPKGKLGDGKTIRHRIITYLPERLLVLQNISTPPGVPGATAYPKIVQIVELTPTATGTRVTLSGAGYGPGADFDALWGFFALHNPEYLASLKALSEAPGK